MAYDFYDVESLTNIFTVVTYKPANNNIAAQLNVYYLDDENLIGKAFGKELPPQFKDIEINGHTDNIPNEDFWSPNAMHTRYLIMHQEINADRNELGHLKQRIYECNPILDTIKPNIYFYDMRTPLGAYQFIREFLYRPDSESKDTIRSIRVKRPNGQINTWIPAKHIVKDTDAAFDKNPDKYPYLLGYNSYNYDTTIIAYVLTNMFNLESTYINDVLSILPLDLESDEVRGFNRTFKASDARKFNNLMFADEYRSNMPSALRDQGMCRDNDSTGFSWQTTASMTRDAMMRTGRHLDVARLNEKQSKVGLKRLLGMMGFQILESDKLSEQTSTLNNADEVFDLIAYNVSDVVYLAELFEDPVYKSQFEQKGNMLKAYPELVYHYKNDRVNISEDKNGNRTAQVDKKRVRFRRLYADASSQQLASRSLCPEGNLTDLPKVSLMYPHEKNTHAADTTIPENVFRRDILEESKEFFFKEVLPRVYAKNQEEGAKAEADFMHIYNEYLNVCRHNFDGREEMVTALNKAATRIAQELKTITDTGTLVTRDDINTLCDKYKNTNNTNDLTLSQALEYLTDNEKDEIVRRANEESATSVEKYISQEVYALSDIRIEAKGLPYNLFYYDGDGNRTSCFATFSTGGVHGAEFALAAYERENEAARLYNENLKWLQSIFGNDDEGARNLRQSVKTATTPITILTNDSPQEFPDKRQDHLVKEFLSNVTLSGAKWAKPKKYPVDVFEQKREGGPNKLRPAYAWTSAAYVNHEDFSSYYPSLLRMMRVFYNDQLGYDRYGEIYADKERLGRLMKATKDAEEKYRLGLDRAGVKLILNTASGAGDAKFDNPVRMNNNIIAMRIIGQLFTWRIGQAQALHGAKVVSTNTDGLYTKLDREKNDRLLEEEAKKIGVLIEPEPMYLISKDSNNRIEFDIVATTKEEAPIVGFDNSGNAIHAELDPRRGLTDKDGNTLPEHTPVKFKVLSVAGATLACRQGPNPARSLAHPAATDWALSEYLMRIFARGRYHQSTLQEPFDRELGKQIINELHSLKDSDHKSRVHGLMMFQNVIASNPSSFTFTYTNNLTPDQEELLARLEWWDDEADTLPTMGPAYHDAHGNVQHMQHYNRVFIMKPKTANTTHIYDAMARIVPKPTITSRKKHNIKISDTMSEAARIIINAQGLNPIEIMGTGEVDRRDIISKKHSGIEPNWAMRIENADLWRLSDDAITEIYENLDLDIYVLLLEEVFENNWRNHL